MWGRGEGARVSEFFFTKNQNQKLKKNIFLGRMGGVRGRRRGRWMDRRTGPNQFAPSTFSFVVGGITMH